MNSPDSQTGCGHSRRRRRGLRPRRQLVQESARRNRVGQQSPSRRARSDWPTSSASLARFITAYEDVLRDPRVDIVNISGPSHVHAEQAIAAAESGRHVLVEKPMVLTMDENRAVRDAVAKSGVKSIVGFVLRWNPDDREPARRCWPSGRSETCSTPKSTTGTDSGPAYRGWDWASRESHRRQRHAVRRLPCRGCPALARGR